MRLDVERVRVMIAEWYERWTRGDQYGQTRQVADLLLSRCLAEARRVSDDELALEARLMAAGEFLRWLQYALAPQAARRAWIADEVAEADRKEAEQAKGIVWRRHDPSTVYALGHLRTNYPDVEKGEVASAAAQYLARPWMRHPVLDWIIVDALVTGEVIAYGEALKERWMDGPSDPLLRVEFFRKHGGDIEVLKREGKRHRRHPVRSLILFEVVTPVIAFAVAIYYGYGKTALAIAALTILDWARILIGIAVWAVCWLVATPEQRAGPKGKAYRLFEEMREVWALLSGPIVNPTLLRTQMEKARQGGAVFDNVAWAVLDRVIAADPAVWIVTATAG